MSVCRYRRLVVGLLLLGGIIACPAVSLGARMAAKLQTDTIYFGTQTLLIVEVSDAPQTAAPVVESVDGLQITQHRSPRVVRDMFRGTTRRVWSFFT